MSRFLRIVAVVLSVLSFPAALTAQFHITGSDPGRLRWSQIDIDGFRIVYPQGLDSLAFKYAFLFETGARHSLDGLNAGFGPEQRKRTFGSRGQVPVILHTYSSQQNGVVVWAPKRMELYTIPTAQGNALDWARDLSLHETRHVAQMQKAGEHFFKGLHYVLGEQSEGLSAAVFDFFSPGLLEGDAVWAETRYSNAGRGRQASFLMPYKALFLSDTHYSYDKYQFGSYRDAVPDKYAMGFLRLSAAPNQGQTAGVFEGISRNPFRYNRAYKESLGGSISELWTNAKEVYTAHWQAEDSLRGPFDTPTPVSAPEKRYVAYSYPTMLSGRLFAIRSAKGENDQLVEIIDGKPHPLCLTGAINGTMTGQGHWLYWTETVFSGRWEHESFSVLTGYDTETGTRHILSRKTRYYNPSIAPDGRRVALTEYLPDGRSQLVIYLPEINQFHTQQAFPRGTTLKESAWINDHELAITVQYLFGLGLLRMDIDGSGSARSILDAASSHTIQRLTVHDGRLFFDSDMDGTDNLYAVDLKDNTLHRLTNARFGAFQPSIDTETGALYYTQYSTKGFEVVCQPIDSTLRIETDHSNPAPTFFDQLLQQSGQTQTAESYTFPKGLNDTTLLKDYQVKKYSKASHLFRFHSWAPLYYDKDELSSFNMNRWYDAVAPGVMAMTQNDLSTAYGQIGYSYHQGHHAGHAKFTYTGWYPVLSGSFHYNNTDLQDIEIQDDTTLYSNPQRKSIEAQLLTYIPFRFNSKGWNRQLVPSVRWSFTNNSYKQASGSPFYENILSFGLQWNSYRAMTACDLFPRLGYGMNIQYYTMAASQNMFTDVFYANAHLYFPGFWKNHAFKLKGAMQRQILPDCFTSVYYLTSPLSIRGLKKVVAPSMFSLSLDYAFPVNTDWSIPHVAYIKRLELTPFVDYLQTENLYAREQKRQQYLTAGLEASANFNPLRMTCSLTMGVRFNYNLKQGTSFEFLFSTPFL